MESRHDIALQYETLFGPYIVGSLYNIIIFDEFMLSKTGNGIRTLEWGVFMERDLEWFVARENIRHFKDQLVNCADEQLRRMLSNLLAAEEAKLQALGRRAARREQHALEIEQSQTALRNSIAEIERVVNSSDEMLAGQGEREEDDTQRVKVLAR